MTPRQLMLRYEYMFADPNIRTSLYRGWFGIFVRLCSEVDAVLGDDKHWFRWLQVKEKVGAGRYYWRFPVDQASVAGQNVTADSRPSAARCEEVTGLIRSLVEEAEAATRATCIGCGVPGRACAVGGWLTVLCDSHRPADAFEAESLWILAADDEVPWWPFPPTPSCRTGSGACSWSCIPDVG